MRNIKRVPTGPQTFPERDVEALIAHNPWLEERGEGTMTPEIDFDEAYEPDWDSLKEVNYACGHPGLADRCEDDPGPGDVCWNCQLCSGCGQKNSECACVWHDPFA